MLVKLHLTGNRSGTVVYMQSQDQSDSARPGIVKQKLHYLH